MHREYFCDFGKSWTTAKSCFCTRHRASLFLEAIGYCYASVYYIGPCKGYDTTSYYQINLRVYEPTGLVNRAPYLTQFARQHLRVIHAVVRAFALVTCVTSRKIPNHFSCKPRFDRVYQESKQPRCIVEFFARVRGGADLCPAPTDRSVVEW